MCRFTAYLGNKPMLIKSVLGDPTNSLIHQSKSAKEGKTGVNGDGFGIGWYNHEIDHLPAVFKSILPAWNDENLINISSKIASECFMGHVRASTVGSVNSANCHPFSYKKLLFMHNGTIRDFRKIKKKIIDKIADKYLDNIKGQTDSEYLFALFCTMLGRNIKAPTSKHLVDAFKKTFLELHEVQQEYKKSSFSRLNLVITDGNIMVATRYSSRQEDAPLSLYYNDLVDDGFLISSEVLNATSKRWKKVPKNHFVIVEKNQNFKISNIML
jgi:glutamine amidotransferase